MQSIEQMPSVHFAPSATMARGALHFTPPPPPQGLHVDIVLVKSSCSDDHTPAA
jgi:hypothetical protein